MSEKKTKKKAAVKKKVVSDKDRLQKFIGQTGIVSYGKVTFRVRITNVRVFAGREEVYVEPIGGTAGTWKYLSSVQIDGG